MVFLPYLSLHPQIEHRYGKPNGLHSLNQKMLPAAHET
jgi:hypothetical protein